MIDLPKIVGKIGNNVINRNVEAERLLP